MSIVPSIIIPSQNNMFDMNITLIKGVNPIQCDNSAWFSVVYEIWDISDINTDLLNRINKLDDKNVNDMKKCVTNIKEGISILKKKIIKNYNDEIMANNMCKNLEMLLSFSRLSQISKCYYEALKVINNPKTTPKYFEKIISIFRKTFSDYDHNVIDSTCKNLEILFSHNKV
jgi:hypothetical protein